MPFPKKNMEKVVEQDRRLFLIIILSLVIVAIVITANLFSLKKMEQLTLNQLLDNQAVKTKFAASEIEAHVQKVQEELVTLSKSPSLDFLYLERCTALPASSVVIGEKTESLLLADESGKIIGCAPGNLADYLGLNIKDKDYFKMPKQSSEPFITTTKQNGKQIIVAVPLFETSAYTPYPNFLGSFKGVLFSIIDLSRLYSLYLHPLISLQQSSFLIISVPDSEVVVENNNRQYLDQLKDIVSVKSKYSRLIRELPELGATIVTSADIIVGQEQWKLIALTPLQNAAQEVLSVKRGQLLSLLFVVLVIIGTSLFSIMTYRSKIKIKQKLDQAQVTLEKVGIQIQTEANHYAPSDIVLQPRRLYLLQDEEEQTTMELFISALNQGYAGLGLSRDDPRVLRQKYGLQKTSFIWLTKVKVEGLPCEKNIETLVQLIEQFVRKSIKSVIMIDDIDYLVLENGLESVLKALHGLKDLASSHECIIVMAVTPGALEESQQKMIAALAQDVYQQGAVKLLELELNILRRIHEHNLRNKLISFKDITREFNITKPTTRVKIQKLQLLGLLLVEEFGRFKSLKITSKGRRLI